MPPFDIEGPLANAELMESKTTRQMEIERFMIKSLSSRSVGVYS